MILLIDGDTREAISDTSLLLGLFSTLSAEQQGAAIEAARRAQQTPVPAVQTSRIHRPPVNGVAAG